MNTLNPFTMKILKIEVVMMDNKLLHRFLFGFGVLLVVVALAACSQERGEHAESVDEHSTTPDHEQASVDSGDGQTENLYEGGPATIVIADFNSGMRENADWVEQFFVQPVRRQHPEITVEMSPESVQNLVNAGMPPDIVLISNPRLHIMMELELPDDLSDMITKYQIDLNEFDPAVVGEIQRLSGEAFYGLPFSMNYGATVYNKDIFDRFGVDYPVDGMNWEEYYELARQLTRMDENVQYIGMLAPNIGEFLRQYTLPSVDLETMQANLTTDKHLEVFSLLQRFYSIPGYIQDGRYDHNQSMFYGDQVIAMYPWWILNIITSLRNDGVHESFNWDITTFPVLNHAPDIGKQVDFHMAVVNQASANKEAAYQVVLQLISEEVQSGLSKAGRISPLVDGKIRGLFGSDSDMLDGVDLSAIFSVQPAPMPDISKYDFDIEGMLRNETMREIVVNEVDVNTALRLAEEKVNKEMIIDE